MVMKYTNIFYIPRPSKFYPNCYFWFENNPSGNPGLEKKTSAAHSTLICFQVHPVDNWNIEGLGLKGRGSIEVGQNRINGADAIKRLLLQLPLYNRLLLQQLLLHTYNRQYLLMLCLMSLLVCTNTNIIYDGYYHHYILTNAIYNITFNTSINFVYYVQLLPPPLIYAMYNSTTSTFLLLTFRGSNLRLQNFDTTSFECRVTRLGECSLIGRLLTLDSCRY
jgi:hypothetical protein